MPDGGIKAYPYFYRNMSLELSFAARTVAIYRLGSPPSSADVFAAAFGASPDGCKKIGAVRV